MQWWNEWIFIPLCWRSLSSNFQITRWGDARYYGQSSNVSCNQQIHASICVIIGPIIQILTNALVFNALFTLSDVLYTDFQVLINISLSHQKGLNSQRRYLVKLTNICFICMRMRFVSLNCLLVTFVFYTDCNDR